MNEKTLKGFIYGIIAAAAYGMNPVFAVPLYKAGMDPVSVLFFRYLLGVPAIWILMMLRRRSVDLGVRLISRISFLGLLMVASSLALFFSYTSLDIGVASTILFIYPLFVALIMVMFYNEIITAATFLSMLGALLGVFLLCGSTVGAVISWSGILLVVASALFYAVYIALVNHKPYSHISTLSLTFWVLVSGLVVLGVVVLVRGELACPRTVGMWFNTLMLAVVPTVISFLFTNMAIEKIGATSTASLGVFEPLTAVVFGVIMFGESLSFTNIVGMILIMACTTLVITRRDITRRVRSIRLLFPKGKNHRRNN